MATTIEITVTEKEIDELLKRLAEKLREIPNGKERIIQTDLEGHYLVRFDSHSDDYHLRHPDNDAIEQQYQAFLTDPRRV